MSVLDAPELRTAEDALMKHKAPWYYDDYLGDILDAGGHYIMSCYDLGIAEIILRGANSFPSKPQPTNLTGNEE